MVAFWWEDWPGTSVRPAAWSGWIDTAFIIGAAIVLTLVAQVVVGTPDLRGMFESSPGAGHAATFPGVLPLAGAAFTVMLQLTLVCEGWPLRRLPRVTGGLLALGLSWLIAVVLYHLVITAHPASGSGLRSHSGLINGADLGALLLVVGVWQAWWYVAWKGWPFVELTHRAARLTTANLVIIGGGVLTYSILRRTTIEAETITAVAGALIAAGLTASMLFEGAVRPHVNPAWDRLASVTVISAGAALLYLALVAFADSRTWSRVTRSQWVGYSTVAISVSVILHTAVGRRWPFGDESEPSP
jgi:hypothetical protein